MELEHEIIENNIYLIKTIGYINLYNSGALCDLYHKLRKGGISNFIFDLEQTDYIDSSGIGALIHVYSSSKQKNINIRFINFTDPVYKILELTNLIDILPISGSLNEAVKELKEKRIEDQLNIKQIIVDKNSPLLDNTNMHFSEYKIDLKSVRGLSASIAQKAPAEIREFNLLEQQINEIIKNAVKHGNKCDKNKSIKIWFSFSILYAHLIVEDEGEGFQNLEEWNQFFKKRNELYSEKKFDELINYVSYRTKNSDDVDGGNALFAAVEYWNQGVVFNEKRNCVGVKRCF